jgi:hypothetical protein
MLLILALPLGAVDPPLKEKVVGLWRLMERLNWNQATLIAGSVTGKSEGIA